MSTNISPATAVTKARRQGIAPILDTKGMSKAELEALLQQYHAKVNSGSQGFSIRFNDGTDPAPDRVVDGQTVPGSKRDSGSLSVYGFGRNPISLYGGQWIELAESMPAILRAIHERRDAIDAYIAKKTGNSSQAINAPALEAQLSLFAPQDQADGATGSTETEVESDLADAASSGD